MKVQHIKLGNYKRFADLEVINLPPTARLVVLVGPNGSGKSSIFDAFLSKVKATTYNINLEGETGQYYERESQSRSLIELANRIQIKFHDKDTEAVNWKLAFHVRSAYRIESDFQIKQLSVSAPDNSISSIMRIIDQDASVSKNYTQLAWTRMNDLDRGKPDNTTFGEYRKESLGELQNMMRELFLDPTLELQDFGGIYGGAFRFTKGNAENFHYKNLSGGEKAAFDILLDVFIKRQEAGDTIFCIDEPELHVATGLQGRLIQAILELLPKSTQLWIATHSIGIVREAYKIQQGEPDAVSFLDFSDKDFDGPVIIEPSKPNRIFWKNTYKIALDDLSSLVAPQRIIICEGNKEDPSGAFDAEVYNELFVDEAPETLFISQGGSSEVIKSEHIITILQMLAEGIKVRKLIDRDNMTEKGRDEHIRNEIRVLRRREIEEYLYDSKVIETFLRAQGNCSEDIITQVLNKRNSLLEKQDGGPKIKDISRELLEEIRKITKLKHLGNSREQFALQFLVPALRETSSVYNELREDVFGTG